MRISDWSSDVCSSDLIIAKIRTGNPDVRIESVSTVSGKVSGEFRQTAIYALGAAMLAISIYIWVRFEWQFGVGALFAQIGRASCRERVGQYVSLSVVAVSLKKKNRHITQQIQQ